MPNVQTAIVLSCCSCAKCAATRSRYTMSQLDAQRTNNVTTERAVRATLGDTWIVMAGGYDAHHREGLQCVKKITDKRCKKYGYRLGDAIWIDPTTFAAGNVDAIVARLQGVKKGRTK